jgi:hypothetical protein
MIINMKDNLAIENINAEYQKRSYDDLSSEFQRLYPSAVRTIELIQLMYNRLTLVEKLSHKTALKKIYNDHNTSLASAQGIYAEICHWITPAFQDELGHRGLKIVTLKIMNLQN